MAQEGSTINEGGDRSEGEERTTAQEKEGERFPFPYGWCCLPSHPFDGGDFSSPALEWGCCPSLPLCVELCFPRSILCVVLFFFLFCWVVPLPSLLLLGGGAFHPSPFGWCSFPLPPLGEVAGGKPSKSSTTQRRRKPSGTTQKGRGAESTTTYKKDEVKRHHPKGLPDDPTTFWGQFSENKVKHLPKQGAKAKLNLCSIMPLFEKERLMRFCEMLWEERSVTDGVVGISTRLEIDCVRFHC